MIRKRIAHHALVSLLIVVLVLPPLPADANSAKFREACVSNTTKSVPLSAACEQAKMSKNSLTVEKVKTTLFGVGAATAAILMLIPDPSTATIQTCNILGKALPLTATAYDIATGIKNKNLGGAFTGAATAALGTVMAGGPLKEGMDLIRNPKRFGRELNRAKEKYSAAEKNAGTGGRQDDLQSLDGEVGKAQDKLDQAVTDKADQAKVKEKAKAACQAVAISLGLSAATSTFSWITASQAFKVTSDSAHAQYKSQNSRAVRNDTNEPQRFAMGLNSGGDSLGGSGSRTPGSSGPSNSASDGSCDSQNGDGYLSCISRQSPEISAILSNPGIVQGFGKMVGKNLGDFLKNAPDDPNQTANYIGKSMGLGASGTGALGSMLNSMKDEVKQHSPSSADHGVGQYTSRSSSGQKSADAEAMPDFEKMMADMMKAMNPDASPSNTAAATETVFRQLELLPPEKQIENRDISLFLRVGFRYRKTLPKVDQLNWALPQNADSTQRAPAQQ